MTFEEQCHRAASRFLQTAVLVDDRAEFQAQPVVNPNDEIDEFKAPDELAAANDDIATVVGPSTERLDAGAVTQGFAAEGLICSVLKPAGAGTIVEDVLKLSPRSDMIVLDWQMGDDGDIAMSIIYKVLKQDKRTGGRLRLFAIYTGVHDLATVAARIGADLSDLKVATNSFEFADSSNTAKVVILGKGVARDHAAGQASRCVEEAGLASRLVTEFATFSGGILRNATLASMGHLRSNTHRLLARLNSNLDTPLITHFALVNSVEDSQQYLADLILQEIEAQVPLEQIVAEFAGPVGITLRIAKSYRDGRSSTLTLDKDGATQQILTEKQAADLVTNPKPTLQALLPTIASTLGKKQKEISAQFVPETLVKRLYGVLGDTYAEGERKHEEFAVASGIRLANGKSHDFESRGLPTVRLGTIIHAGGEYFMCLTPVCDSVRLPNETSNFLFGLLVRDEAKFNVIVDDAGERIRLLIDRKNVSIRTFRLVTAADRTIRVERRYIDYVVPVAGQSDDYFRWVAEMKPMQAQRVVAAITSNLSRIGLDEFEWLRQLAENWSG
ncbi:hypothetical protein C8J35_101776 [Rhizobium sp. PP-F2F-G38]|nr:hypothetical protein C8J35_101776 [Rhizobium sp. PP-F2F-G38]